MFRINYGYGVAKKGYTKLKNAKIACCAFCKKAGVSNLDIVEYGNGGIIAHHRYIYEGKRKRKG